MNRDDVSWRGYWPACPTPFHQDGSYDPESHRALLELYLELGVHGVLINGTTGEWFSQTADERRLVAETAIDQVAGRVPVVVGCAAYTAREAAEIGRHAIAAGAAGVESTPPPYAKTYDDETVAYYEDLASGVDGPILVYNWPHGTAIDIGPELADRLVEIDRVVALKDSTPNAAQFYETTKTVVDRVRVFGPFMSATEREAFKERSAKFRNIRTLTFTNNLGALMQRAAGVVAMGGYNTFCEILSFDKKAIIVPRTRPRLEQFIRARAARNVGLIEMLDADRGRDPHAMATALRQLPQQGLPSDVVVPGLLDGLPNVWRLVAKQLAHPHRGPAPLEEIWSEPAPAQPPAVPPARART